LGVAKVMVIHAMLKNIASGTISKDYKNDRIRVWSALLAKA
jgi:hypothetical protein